MKKIYYYEILLLIALSLIMPFFALLLFRNDSKNGMNIAHLVFSLVIIMGYSRILYRFRYSFSKAIIFALIYAFLVEVFSFFGFVIFPKIVLARKLLNEPLFYWVGHFFIMSLISFVLFLIEWKRRKNE
jgi:hypothetical protein